MPHTDDIPMTAMSMPALLVARFRRRWNRVLADPDRGSTLGEAVIIVPLIILLTMVVVQFTLLWHGRHVAQAAAQSAARAAAAYRGSAAAGQADGAGYLGQVAPNLLPGAAVQVTRDADTVTAAVHSGVLTVIPFGSFTVDERASAPVEAFSVFPGGGG